MGYSFEEKIDVLESLGGIDPSFGYGLGLVFYTRVLDILGEEDEFMTKMPRLTCNDMSDEVAEIVTELDVFFGGLGACSFCGADKGFGAFEIEGGYVEVPPNAASSVHELIMSCPDPGFTEKEFFSIFMEGRRNSQQEQEELILRAGGVFDALKCFEPLFDLGIETDSMTKLEMCGFWLDGALVDEEEEAYCGCFGSKCQYCMTIKNKTIDAWIRYLFAGTVEECDAAEGGRLLSGLIASFGRITESCSSIYAATFSPGESALFKGDAAGRWFEARCFACHDAIEDGIACAEYFIDGMIPPRILVAMLKVQEFLRRMNERYHFIGDRHEEDL